MAQLDLKGVHKSYGPVKTIHGVDLAVGEGEFVVFVGPSGCGKSTLLRMIAGLEAITEGTVSIDGKVVNDVPAADRGLAMVFQSYALYPHMSVYQNMAFGLENMGLPRAEIEKRVQRATTMLQLEPYLQRKPRMLSGGQRQRVAIGRAIVRDPKIFLFDEPLSNLDAELRVAMRKELAALHAEIGGTMIYVTHDQVEAMTLADRIVVLRAGRIEQVGTPLDLYHRPDNQFVAGFIGSPRMNFLKGTVAAQGSVAVVGGRSLDLPAAADLPVGEEVTVGIRPEHVALCAREDADLAVRLDLVEHLGGETYLYGQGEKLPSLTIRQDGDCAATRGDILPLRLVRERLHLFDSAGRVHRAA
jgi:multiple sugar transport system ATP-binding protein